MASGTPSKKPAQNVPAYHCVGYVETATRIRLVRASGMASAVLIPLQQSRKCVVGAGRCLQRRTAAQNVEVQPVSATFSGAHLRPRQRYPCSVHVMLRPVHLHALSQTLRRLGLERRCTNHLGCSLCEAMFNTALSLFLCRLCHIFAALEALEDVQVSAHSATAQGSGFSNRPWIKFLTPPMLSDCCSRHQITDCRTAKDETTCLIFVLS